MSYTIRLSSEEILALDHYFTRKLGYVGHDGTADEIMHTLVDTVGRQADEIRLDLGAALIELPPDDSVSENVV
jgi:hypothetical protein